MSHASLHTWNHEKSWKTIKNQPGTMKNHEKPWKTNLEPWKNMKNGSNINQKLSQNRSEIDQNRFLGLSWRPLGAILAPRSSKTPRMSQKAFRWTPLDPQVGVQNQANIDIRRCWKKCEKIVMNKMALRSHICGSGWERNLGFGAQGGGRRRGKPLHPTRLGVWVEWLLGLWTSRTL